MLHLLFELFHPLCMFRNLLLQRCDSTSIFRHDSLVFISQLGKLALERLVCVRLYISLYLEKTMVAPNITFKATQSIFVLQLLVTHSTVDLLKGVLIFQFKLVKAVVEFIFQFLILDNCIGLFSRIR